VEVESIPGEGTTFVIKLPLTLAILPSLMSVIDGDVFALPIESIVEIVNISRPQLTSIHGQIATTIRGRVVSVVRLTDLFSWSQPPRSTLARATDDSTLVVITNEGQEIGLIVDHVIGEEDVVIKSLAENYRNIAGVAGASILGDGRVSLILDVGALVEMSSKIGTVSA
jgi:two-component system chemotaxis sensor kinase CheA